MWRIKVFFEYIYWYIFRKIDIDGHVTRAYKLLIDSFNGSDSVVGSLIVKTTHMLYTIRKKSCEELRYINYYDAYTNKKNKSIQNLINRGLSEFDKTKYIDIVRANIKPETDDFRNSILYKGYMDKEGFKVLEIFPKQVGFYDGIDIKDDKIITVKKPNYCYPIDNDNTREILIFKNFKYTYNNFEKVVKLINSYISKSYGDNIEKVPIYVYDASGSGTFTLSPKDYSELDESAKDIVHGMIKSYHTLWKYRDILKKFYIFNNYESYSIEDYKSFERYLEKMSDSLNDIFKKYSAYWWI